MATAVQSEKAPRCNALTHERLCEVLEYCAATGVFTWRVTKRPNIKPGKVAGYVMNRGYIGITIDGLHHKAHRLAWLYTYKAWPDPFIDHINGITSDNRIDNLRLATACENARNTKSRQRIRDLPRGVRHDLRDKNYSADMMCAGKRYYLGRFTTKEEAHAAYCAKSRELFGEYYRRAEHDPTAFEA